MTCPSASARGNNYGYNFNAAVLAPKNLADIKEPARMPLFADVWGSADIRQSYVILIPCGTRSGITMCGRQLNGVPTNPGVTAHADNRLGFVNATIHSDTANYCFADGHVKALRYIDLPPSETMNGCAVPIDCKGPAKAGIDWNGNGTDRADGLYD